MDCDDLVEITFMEKLYEAVTEDPMAAMEAKKGKALKTPISYDFADAGVYCDAQKMGKVCVNKEHRGRLDGERRSFIMSGNIGCL